MRKDNFKFENLEVWKKAMELGEFINKLSATFPIEERFNLASQILRATDSIALNIAEGCIRQSNKEQSKFLGYSIRSLAEVVTCLHKAKMRKYLSEPHFEQTYNFCYLLMNSLIAYQNSLKVVRKPNR
jgi:four helix bundle protein